MRRFIASLPGKVFCHLVVLALVVPYLTLTMIGRAEAQVQMAPQLAVVEFVNRKSPGTNFGVLAAQAIAAEFGKSNAYEVLPEETVSRGIQSLGLTRPVADTVNIVRLGQQLNVGTVVSGDIVDYEVRAVPGGRQALVSMRVMVQDVASGLPVNGAAIVGQSTIRSGEINDETLIADAIAAGAAQAVRQIQARTLPVATVLNTQTDSALVNQGTRSGFKVGQDVIFVRAGSGQVGRGVVGRVDPDQSNINITNYTLGIKPGDRVRVLFTPPDVLPGFGASGTPKVARVSRPISSGLVTTILLVGLLALLVSGGGSGGGNEAVGRFVAEAATPASSASQSAVRLSWTGGLFGGGNRNYVKWQIWRSDVPDTPVAVVNDPSARTYLDIEGQLRSFSWTSFGGQIGGTQCDNAEFDDMEAEDVPGPTAGVPYVYQLNAVYRIARADLPDDGGGTGGGGTGGGGTGGGGTGGGGGFSSIRANARTKALQSTRQESFCYFVSARATSGTATPLRRPLLNGPANNSFPNAVIPFSVRSPFENSASDVVAEYVLQFSTRADFRDAYIAYRWQSQVRTIVSTPSIDTRASGVPSSIRNSDFYWRIGARNALDNPGPEKDRLTGERYIFSQPFLFRRSIQPVQTK